MTTQDEANLRWLREDAQRQERERDAARHEREDARAEWTKRVAWTVPFLTVAAATVATIGLVMHHVETPDPNPTCDTPSLHLRPGETITLSCPTTLSGHDQSITPQR